MAAGAAALSIDTVIVGGGFAGLSAATALAEKGQRVLVLEARPTLGGRATAFTDPVTGERVDNGQHVLFGCYHETFQFLSRIGALDGVRLQPTLSLAVVEESGVTTRLTCPPLPAPLHLLVGIARWNALSWRDRVAALRVGLSLRGMHYPEPDARTARRATVREWLLAQGQTPRLIQLLWEPLAVAALNQPIDVAAAAPFVATLRGLFGRNPRDAAVALPVKPLDELYAEPARTFIEARGGEVRTGAPARIRCGDRPVVLVRNETIAARAVICAVAWYALPGTVLDPPRQLAEVLDAARRTPSSSIVTVNLWWDREVTREAFIGLPGRTMQWLFDKQQLFGGGASHLSLVSSGADAVVGVSSDVLVAQALDEVRAALPSSRTAVLRRSLVVREKRATFSVAPDLPARPPTRTEVPALFLAGDWIETGLPATIEGAVMSGHRAAAAITA